MDSKPKMDEKQRRVLYIWGAVVVVFVISALLLAPAVIEKPKEPPKPKPFYDGIDLIHCNTSADCKGPCGKYGTSCECMSGICYKTIVHYPTCGEKGPFEKFWLPLLTILYFLTIIALILSFMIYPQRHAVYALWFIVFLVIGIFLLMLWMAASTVVVSKPVIYLYPEETTLVSVEVIPDAGFHKTIPPIVGNRWKVIAHPSGELEFKGGKYPYLFYESKTYERHNPPKGWVVEAGEVVDWFNEYLPRMGLNEQETADFVDYWSIHLPEANYFRISQIDPADYDRSAHLTIMPEPDTLIRVILLIEALDEPVDIEEPVLTAPERNGFTAVEWGVILD